MIWALRQVGSRLWCKVAHRHVWRRDLVYGTWWSLWCPKCGRAVKTMKREHEE